MFVRVGLAAAALALLSSPAFAAGQCSPAPVGPVVPTAAEITAMDIPAAQTKLNSVFADLHVYQSQLKTYRACLNSAMAADQNKVNSAGAQKDAGIKKDAQEEYAQYAQDFNSSVDAEKSVADQINQAAKAHCARDTSDFCKPKG
jgi:hypothetical protein